MSEYRSIPEERRETFDEYVSYAFVPENGPPEEFDPEEVPERATLGAMRGLYPDGSQDGDDRGPLCVCKHHWFDATVRGEVHPIPGLSMVASPPENRRGGHVRELLEASLEEYRDRGARFSVLWPFQYGFYRKYGWDTCNKRATYECDPEALAFAAEALEGDRFGGSPSRYRKVEADEYEDLIPAYEAHADRYALSIQRVGNWWRYHLFTRWTTDPYVYAWERDGDVRGYLVYTIAGDWSDRSMRVGELAFVDREAYLALLAFCYNHDSQVSEVSIGGPAESELLDLAPEPEAIDCEIGTGPMVRIVDVAETLAALSYPPIDARATIAVDDPLVDWNDGTFALSVESGAATCERVDTAADRSNGGADCRIDVAALSQLAIGYRSAADLERAGRLEADSSGVVSTLDGLFPRADVYLREGF